MVTMAMVVAVPAALFVGVALGFLLACFCIGADPRRLWDDVPDSEVEELLREIRAEQKRWGRSDA